MMQGCPVCHHYENKILHDKARNGVRVNNVVCKKCGFVYIHPRISDTDNESKYLSGNYFNEVFTQNSFEQLMKDSERTANFRFSRYFPLFEKYLLNCQRVLEIGCGTGSLLNLLAQNFSSVIGVEPSFNYANLGRSKYGLEIKNGLYESTHFEIGLFDLIVAFHVLEHISNPHNMISKMWDELKINGLLFIEVPCIEKPYNGNLDLFFWDAHIQTYSRTSLSNILKVHGFSVLEWGYSGDFLYIIVKKTDKPVAARKYLFGENWLYIYVRTRMFYYRYLINIIFGKKINK